MAKDNSFRDYILDQLSDWGGITCRAMFGGYGLYQNGVFFAVLTHDELYFKVDDESRPIYRERQMKPFLTNEHEMTSTYYQVPIEIIEDNEALMAWAIRAREAAVKLKNKPKAKKPKKTAPGN